MQDGRVIREVFSEDDPLFLDAMELYVETFPRDEREPLSYFRENISPIASHRLGHSARNHLLVAESEGQLLGMRWFSYYPEASIGFLVYLAVDARFRRQGIGEQLIKVAIEQCKLDAMGLDAKLEAVCFEAERIDLAEDEADRATRQKRLAYFTQRGADCITPGYVQPPLTDDREPVPLNLMAYMIDPSADKRRIARDFCVHCLGYEASDSAVAAAVADVGKPYR